MDKQLPDIQTHFADWYHEVVYASELADQAPVRGCIVIRPYGYAIWERMTHYLDRRFKDTGHENAAFPLLIPNSFFQKEAEHVEGFSPELAMVTHAGGKELEEPLAVRPTSETMIHHMFARWIDSWRDLPMKVNQWCSVVRWEKRPRPFIRTSEFWWQEGHTAHETREEAQHEALQMRDIYRELIEDLCAIPTIIGEKSEQEKFAGAETTHTLEGIMQDGRALQMATSHQISQSFARAFEMSYHNRDAEEAYPYLTSWGTTTRLIGAIIMMHGDQKGLVLPPHIAPIQIVIVPIIKKGHEEAVTAEAHRIYNALKVRFRVKLDDDHSHHPGYKFNKWELKGVPIRIEVGPRDAHNEQAVVVDRLQIEKQAYAIDDLESVIYRRLNEFHTALYQRAQHRLYQQWHHADTIDEFGHKLAQDNGAYQTGWCGRNACEDELKQYQATIRCLLPHERRHQACCVCGERSENDIIVAKAY